MKNTKKILSTVLLLSLTFSIGYADNAQDQVDVKTSVNNMRNASIQQGVIGEVLTKLFDTNGKIKTVFYDFVGGLGTGFIPFMDGSGNFANSPLFILAGKVGIGTNTPGSKLEVNGALKIRAGAYTATSGTTHETRSDAAMIWSAANSALYFEEGGALRNILKMSLGSNDILIGQNGTSLIDTINLIPGSSGIVNIFSSGAETMRVVGGKVGIGTNNPSETLSLSGGLSLTKNPDSGDDVGDRDYNDSRYVNVGESIPGDSISDGSIDSSEIEDNTLTANDLAINSVGNDELNDDVTFTYVRGPFGNMLKSTDEWLRLNEGSTHTSGVYVPNILRADGGFQVGGENMINGNGEKHTAKYNTDSHYGYFEVKNDSDDRGAYFGFGNGSTEVTLDIDYADKLNITGGDVHIAQDLGIGTTAGGTFANNKSIALGDSDTGIRQDGDGHLELWTNNVERLHVSTDEVEVRNNTLKISGSSPTIRYLDSNNNNFFQHINGNKMYFMHDANNNNIWDDGDDDSIVMYSPGDGLRLGIGTNTPAASLEVKGNIISDAPTANNHVATKAYVDSVVSASSGGDFGNQEGTYYSVGGSPHFCKKKVINSTGYVYSYNINPSELCGSDKYCSLGTCATKNLNQYLEAFTLQTSYKLGVSSNSSATNNTHTTTYNNAVGKKVYVRWTGGIYTVGTYRALNNLKYYYKNSSGAYIEISNEFYDQGNAVCTALGFSGGSNATKSGYHNYRRYWSILSNTSVYPEHNDDKNVTCY